jgi:hypothetical protein
MKKPNRFTVLLAMSVLALANVALAQEVPPPPPPQDAPADAQTTQALKGKVKSFNFDNRGELNGLILADSDKIIQINFPPQIAKTVKAGIAVGEQVFANVTAERGPPPRGPDGGPGGAPTPDPVQATHPVYRLVTLTDSKGKQIDALAAGARKPIHVESAVKAVNYDMRGTPNGAQLFSGEFVSISPREAQGLNLAANQSLVIDGYENTSPEGTVLIAAVSVNGTFVRPDRGPGGDGPDGGPPDGGPPDGGPPDGGPPGPPPPGR